MTDRFDALDFDMVPRPEPDKPRFAWWTRSRVVALVTVIGLLLRLWAAWQLPIDADEPVYLAAAYDYARFLDDGDLGRVINYPGNSEHPPLMKLMYAGIQLALGQEAGIAPALFFSRLVSVLFGTLQVFTASLIDPLGGFFLAIQTLVAKYTSEVYLEALPSFAIVWAIYALLKAKTGGGRWFWLSAAGLGLAAAGKFSYFPILAPIAYILIWENKTPWHRIILYVVAAAVVFFALNPAIWPDPVGRLTAAVSFHSSYSQSAHVQSSGYGPMQPFLWVSSSWGYDWHPDVFLYHGIDFVIFVLGLGGAVLEWRRRRWLAVWIVTSMIFLVLWPTRWPQYTLVVLPAYCLAASTAFRLIYAWVMRQEYTWGWFSAMIPHPPKGVRIGLIVLGVLMVGVYIGYFLWLGVQRMAWSHLTTNASPLPSNSVYDIEPLPDGRMVVGTSGGAAIWIPPDSDELISDWEIYTPESSGLREANVLAVALSPAGELWFGTLTGIDVYNPDTGVWRAVDLPGVVQVNDLAFDSSRTWAATDQGLFAIDGTSWELVEAEGSAGEFAFTTAVQGETVWAGFSRGLLRLDASSMEGEFLPNSQIGLGTGGLSQILVDSTDRVWVSSLGGGVAYWDGESWQSYRVDNSDLPGSVIQDVFEDTTGSIWVSVAFPNTAGGVAARLEGDHWRIFRSNTSGYSGAEALDIAADNQGRLWFGTITRGIDIYEATGDR